MPYADPKEVIRWLNTRLPPCLRQMEGRVTEYWPQHETLEMTFRASEAHCHSQVIVQGGFTTAMADGAMAHLLLALYPNLMAMPTYSLTTSFMRPARIGNLTVQAILQHSTRGTAFVATDVYQGGRLTAHCTSTMKLVTGKPVGDNLHPALRDSVV